MGARFAETEESVIVSKTYEKPSPARFYSPPPVDECIQFKFLVLNASPCSSEEVEKFAISQPVMKKTEKKKKTRYKGRTGEKKEVHRLC